MRRHRKREHQGSFASDHSAFHGPTQASRVRQWLRLARHQVRKWNPSSTPFSGSNHTNNWQGKELDCDAVNNPNLINQTEHESWSLDICEVARGPNTSMSRSASREQISGLGSLPHTHWKAPIPWSRYQTNNKQETQKELQEKWLSNRISIYNFFGGGSPEVCPERTGGHREL